MATAEQARGLLSLHGVVRPQGPDEWGGAFPLPTAAERFYQEVGLADVSIEAHGNPYFIPRLARLWGFQAGYRWDGLTGGPIEDWNDDWLVIADEGGDPFILSRSSGRVLHAYHGEGEWEADELFPDLNTMAACLAQLGAVALEAGEEFVDEDCSIRPEWRDRAAAQLGALLGSGMAAESALHTLGWG